MEVYNDTPINDDSTVTVPPSDDKIIGVGKKVTIGDTNSENERVGAQDPQSKPSFDRRKLLIQSKSQKSRCGSIGKSIRNIFTSFRTKVVPKKKRVAFGAIEVREHEVTLGDNPSCSHGPPVGMKWEHKSEFRMSVDEYEEGRDGQRRGHRELVMPRRVREKMLREDGVSRGEMNTMVSENMVIKESNRNSTRRYLAKQRFVGKIKKVIPGLSRRSSNPT